MGTDAQTVICGLIGRLCGRPVKSPEQPRTGSVLCRFVFLLVALFLLAIGFTGCSRHKIASTPPPAPPASETAMGAASPPASAGPAQKTGNEAQDEEASRIPPGAKALLVETGIASWYGAPYHNRRGSDGKIYDMNALTAAHRTLPLGSVVRVTNIKTGNWAIVRITDRGPFIKGRILDLSLAAAKKVDIVRPGIAEVRIEVLEAPSSLSSGGRWAVQIGGFDEQKSASKIADQISRRYHTSRVLSFSSPVGDWWVRVRVLNDDRARAQEIVRDIRTDEGAVFLVRLD